MLSEFLKGFVASPTEIAVFVVVVVAFLAFLTWYAVATQRRARRRRRAEAEQRYADLVGELKLTRSDEEAIERLAEYLRFPEKKYILLQNHGIFNSCAERALNDGVVSDGTVSALRVRIGYSGDRAARAVESSVEIPAGAGVVLLDERDRLIRARVAEPDPAAFRVEIDPDGPRLIHGAVVEVIYHDGSGIYAFETGVLVHNDAELQLSHSEQVRRVQRRRYYRGRLRLPVYMKLARRPDRPVQTELVDIGGGGASIVAPDDRYERGVQVELTFHPDSIGTLHLSGSVVRVSHRGRLLHVSFDNLARPQRDQLVGFALRRDTGRDRSD